MVFSEIFLFCLCYSLSRILLPAGPRELRGVFPCLLFLSRSPPQPPFVAGGCFPSAVVAQRVDPGLSMETSALRWTLLMDSQANDIGHERWRCPP